MNGCCVCLGRCHHGSLTSGTLQHTYCDLHQPRRSVAGWICPACGGGVAPQIERCPCTPDMTLGASPARITLVREGGQKLG
jgi:hypothetical protein